MTFIANKVEVKEKNEIMRKCEGLFLPAQGKF